MSEMTQEDVIARIAAKRIGTYEEPEPTDEQEQVEAEAPAEEEADEPDVEEGEDAGEESEPEEVEAEEEEAEGEEEPDEGVPADDFYVARYKTREEAERGYAEARTTTSTALQRAAEAERRAQEVEARLRALEQQPQQPEHLDREEWLEWAAGEVTARNPREVFKEAVIHSGEEAGYIVIDAMYATGEPHMMREATTLATDYRMALQQEQEKERRAPQIAAQQEAAQRRDSEDAFLEMKRLYPDFDEVWPVMASLIEELDQADDDDEDKIWAQEVGQMGRPGKLKVMKDFYYRARASAPDTLVEARVQKARKTEERSRSKKIAASVASATASPERTPLTEADRYAIQRKNEMRKFAGEELLGEE